VTDADDEWHRAASDHLREIADPSEVDDQGIEVLETDLVGGLGESVLRVGDEGRQRALQVAELIEREGDKESAATNYGRKKTEEDDRGGGGPRETETAFQQTDHWKEHKRQHPGPNEWTHDVTGAIHDVERSYRE
jgi:hypothetical protein